MDLAEDHDFIMAILGDISLRTLDIDCKAFKFGAVAFA